MKSCFIINYTRVMYPSKSMMGPIHQKHRARQSRVDNK